MATPILIIGKSGSGKSASMRNCVGNDDWRVIRVLNKPFPFKGKIDGWHTDSYTDIKKCLASSKANNVVIDDAGYLITDQFMNNHSSTGKGNAVFELYNNLADYFWSLIQYMDKLPKEKIVYFIMHEDKNEFGDVKPKTIGKLLDDKVCIEGMFTIVLRAIVEGDKHLFVTQAADGAVSKSPIGMFNDLTIDNDILIVESAVREYYADTMIVENKKEEEKKNAEA